MLRITKKTHKVFWISATNSTRTEVISLGKNFLRKFVVGDNLIEQSETLSASWYTAILPARENKLCVDTTDYIERCSRIFERLAYY